ncbi:MAG: SDR family oxidoreductase [Pseudomonadota bacterium]
MTVTIDFADRVVVVVGGTSGINRGVAEAFASHGARLAVASRSQEKVDDTVKALREAGAGEAIGAAFDVRDPKAVAESLAAFREELGAFDIVVSGAAGNFPAFGADMSVNAYKSVIDIDLMGTIHVMKGVYPLLKRPGASIINISAPQAYMPYETQSHVCAAKAGVDQITRTLALEWGREGVRINSVVPGMIEDTEGFRRLTAGPNIEERVIRATPLGRVGAKADVANACLFLCSELAEFISGQVIVVDGGVYLRGSGQLGQDLADMMRSATAS